MARARRASVRGRRRLTRPDVAEEFRDPCGPVVAVRRQIVALAIIRSAATSASTIADDTEPTSAETSIIWPARRGNRACFRAILREPSPPSAPLLRNPSAPALPLLCNVADDHGLEVRCTNFPHEKFLFLWIDFEETSALIFFRRKQEAVAVRVSDFDRIGRHCPTRGKR